ncbi:hypothetical protein [Mycobacterium intracellulare]|uniref:hypothetical protein n=1 Tax=Mycobacterium intracellulare TaxID=1767 RepID=UPI0009ECAD11|nr:hypothetical protein [Mycobacterium intracellulare]MDM3908803.1 hypothetical protein [Mycobacterium intracellulare subsp. chimaera]
MAVLLLVAKVALIAFIVGGTVVLITRGVRRSRANRLDPRWKYYGAQPGYEASVHGAMPNTPLPEWVYWDDEGDDGRARTEELVG